MAKGQDLARAFCYGAERGKASNLEIKKGGKGTLFVNYQTPIAYRDNNGNIFITDKKFSPSTTRRQNDIKRNCFAKEIDNDKYKSKLIKDGVFSLGRL